MEGGDFLQVDKAAPADKAVLGRNRQCRENSNMDYRRHLCASGYFETRIENIALYERNVTIIQRVCFRQDACKSAF